MLYRLRPPAGVTWCAAPGDTVRRTPAAELDRLPWAPTQERAFSHDLLRIAVRHGVASAAGLVLDVRYTLDLGRADDLRTSQMAVDQAQAGRRERTDPLERLFPESAEWGARLEEKLRRTTELVAREAEADLAEVLAAPVRAALVTHWLRLGGHYPD
jgi:hypothetical protein